MPSLSRGRKSSTKLKTIGDHNEFLSRITKSLYYSKLPMTDRLSLPVTEFAAELFSEVKGGCTLERLDVEEASRISRNACVSPCSFVLALLYLERLKDCNPEYLYKVAPSELFLVSLMIASKFLNDEGEEDGVLNNEWAKSGNLTVPEINRLEKDFLDAINWGIYVHNQDFWERLRKLEKDVAYKEAQKRGWFSYTELACLMDTVKLASLVQVLVSISSICLATYAAGVVTLMGSALVASHVPGTSLAPKTPTVSVSSTTNDPITSETEGIVDIDDFSIDSSNSSTSHHSTQTQLSEMQQTNWSSWASLVTNWLPEYKENQSSEFSRSGDTFGNSRIGQRCNNIGTFITDTEPFVGEKLIWDELVTEINWKETIKENLENSNKDWRYYAGYVTQISLGHHH